MLAEPELITKSLTWPERIERAKVNGEFTFEDRFLAVSWRTCAVGEKLGLEEYNDDKAYELVRTFYANYDSLGLQFLGAVEEDDVDFASKTFDRIMKIPFFSAEKK